MIIPYYAEGGFLLDFTKTIPIDYDNLAMYIHPRISLIFKAIWSPEKNCMFSIGYAMESGEDFDCSNFRERLTAFHPFRMARVRRVFDKKRSSAFFDDEEVQLLAGIFKSEKFTALISIAIDGKETDIEKVPPNIYKIVKPFLESYQVTESITIDEYRTFRTIKKVRIKGVDKVSVKNSILGIVAGVVITGISSVGLIIGGKLILSGTDVITGSIIKAEVVK